MHKLAKCLPKLGFLVTLFYGSIAYAATDYYVATVGSDSNPGTLSAPFLTLQRAANVATAGTTVHVAPGTYNQSSYCSIPALGVSAETTVCMQTSGTAAAPITFISDTKWGAKLTCPNGTSGSFFFLVASHIVVSGFDMTCPNGSDGWAAGMFGNNGYNTFFNNYLHDFSVNACISVGILMGSNASHLNWTNTGHNIYDSNVIRHGGANDSRYPQCNQYHGIYMTSTYEVATNNIVSGMIGIGIQSYGGGVCHQTISNNTVFDNSQGGIIAENTGATSGYADMCGNGGVTDYETITNNIAVNNGYGNGYSGQDGGIHLYGSTPSNPGTHNLISNNVAYGNSNWQSLATFPAGVNNTISGTNASVFSNYQSDKNWAPASNYNFQNYAERSGSTSIGAGIATGAPANDIVGVARPQGGKYDIGAFQDVVATPGPPPPPRHHHHHH
ncbi:MAG: right-handed parallel beta-helix repeat-containing protein [Methylocella sp.]